MGANDVLALAQLKQLAARFRKIARGLDAKTLKMLGWRPRIGRNRLVVPTYPVDRLGGGSAESGHVSSLQDLAQGRQGAPFLEPCREPSSSWRPGGSAPGSLSGRDQRQPAGGPDVDRCRGPLKCLPRARGPRVGAAGIVTVTGRGYR